MNCYQINDLQPGLSETLEILVTASDIRQFATLSGDISPIHVDEEFARSKGFRGTIAHGALLAAYVSRFIGVQLPGRYGVLQRLDLEFRQPCYAGTRIQIQGHVDRCIESVSVVKIKITIMDLATGTVLANGSAQSGVTANRGTATSFERVAA